MYGAVFDLCCKVIKNLTGYKQTAHPVKENMCRISNFSDTIKKYSLSLDHEQEIDIEVVFDPKLKFHLLCSFTPTSCINDFVFKVRYVVFVEYNYTIYRSIKTTNVGELFVEYNNYNLMLKNYKIQKQKEDEEFELKYKF
jgi:hypothetical protein